MLIILISCSTDHNGETIILKHEPPSFKEFTSTPPHSLDSLYPPYSDEPIYQIKMFALAKPLTAIGLDIFDNNMKQAKNHFEEFREQYLEISKVVPEWQQAYPKEPVDKLDRALSTGEQEKIMLAMGNIAKICQDCHIINMPKIQQKYHWENFSEIIVTDPVTNQEMDYKQHMLSLETSFQGIGINLERGQVENALKHFNFFNMRFQSMKETCTACHETERKYYVDSNIKEMIEKLRETLRSKVPDIKIIGELSRKIGNESCFKCHMVHIPAEYNKIMWRENQMANED
jgi:hypothetical protein